MCMIYKMQFSILKMNDCIIVAENPELVNDPLSIVCHQKGKSKVWKHFGFSVDVEGKILNGNKVTYQLCQKKWGYSKNTSNLFYHLEKEHLIE